MRSFRWRILTGGMLVVLMLNVLPWQDCRGLVGPLAGPLVGPSVGLANVFPTGRVGDPMSGIPDEVFVGTPGKHEVQPGETLSQIASHYGIDARILASANGIRQPDRLRAGQVLTIPRGAPQSVYVVQKGDTLAKISSRYGVGVRELAQANDIDNPNLIRVGQRLAIPGVDYMMHAQPAMTSRFAFGLSDLSWPVLGAVSSAFGQRWGKLHAGIDIATRYGTEVTACSDGVVTYAGKKGGYGNLVMVKHKDGMVSYYGHLSRIEVEPGMEILAGESVGRVGTTGNSTGPHLHFEVRKNGAAVNPRKMLP